MNILLIRHAEPDYENDSLTPGGFEEAEKLAEHLRDVPLTHVYCSPLGRARRTMECVLRGRDLQPVTLDWLAELQGNMGDGEAFWSWNVRGDQLHADPSLAGRIAEFMAEQQQGLLRAWDELMGEHGCRRAGGRSYRCDPGCRPPPLIALFAHAGMIMTLLSGLFRFPLAETYVALNYKPSAITHLRMYRRTSQRAELRLRTLAARPHMGAKEYH